MMKKLTTLRLLIILVTLILVFYGLKFFEKGNKSESLNRALVNFDTTRITEVIIENNTQKIVLSKEDNNWYVQLPNGQNTEAEANKVNQILGNLQSIKPSRLASRKQSKWIDYQVDSTGTEVKIFEGDKTSLDMIIGRSGASGKNALHSFVRLEGENEVYATDNFSGLTGYDQINNYRNQTFADLDIDSIRSIQFNYLADTAFQIEKENGRWLIDNQMQADSTKMINYLRQFDLLKSSHFSGEDVGNLNRESASLKIDLTNQNVLEIKVYRGILDSVVYHSSTNPDSYFNDESLGEKIFKGRNAFLPDVQ